MKRGSTLFLKAVISLIGLGVLALCVFVLPAGIFSDKTGYYRPILIGMYLPAIPFFFALYQGLKLLSLVDKNKAFSELSVKSLKIIKYCGITIGILYGVGLPYIFYVAGMDDAPGVALIGLVFTFAPLIIAVFAAVLEKMLRDTIVIKSENDLTV
ncbi:MAG: DUF2975 domain-containing protein [Patescibacteria group bacterium]|jgi:MFS family permease